MTCRKPCLADITERQIVDLRTESESTDDTLATMTVHILSRRADPPPRQYVAESSAERAIILFGQHSPKPSKADLENTERADLDKRNKEMLLSP